MRFYYFLIFWLGCVFSLQAQVSIDSITQKLKDSTQFKKTTKGKSELKSKEISYKDYRSFKIRGDTIYLDTALTIQKDYSFNFLRNDDFELLPFSNMGQPQNQISRTFATFGIFPDLGASGRNQGYITTEQIDYYKVIQPRTELFFKTTMERGQFLDALLTFNTTEKTNFSFAYSGFRSLGKYSFNQTTGGRFRASYNHLNNKGNYQLFLHYAAQELEGEENGGLLDRENQFESNLEDFSDRGRLDVFMRDANNRISGKRYFLNHEYQLTNRKRINDTLNPRKFVLKLNHQFEYETKTYNYSQTGVNSILGNSVFDAPIIDDAKLRTAKHSAGVSLGTEQLGILEGGLLGFRYRYSFSSKLVTDQGIIPDEISGLDWVLETRYRNSLGKLKLKGELQTALKAQILGNRLSAHATYPLFDDFVLKGTLLFATRMPNFNLLLYQSDYENFNWYNFLSFQKEQTQTLTTGFYSNKWGDFEINFSRFNNYSYFGLLPTDDNVDVALRNNNVRPFQAGETLEHLKLTYEKEIKWRKWAWLNRVLIQKVAQDQSILNLPDLIVRSTLYYSSDVFNKAMYVQSGITLKYFDSYFMDGYHPLLSEFYTQNIENLGGFPLMDVFVNAKVRRTRLFLKAEHLNAMFSQQPKYYSAPNYPYRDFIIRFGLIWDFIN